MARKKARPCGNPETGGSLVQSLHFDKRKHLRGTPKWSPRRAQKWARGEGFVASKVDETKHQYRVRQFDPGHCEYRVVPFGKGTGISGVIEFARPRKSHAPAHVVRKVDEELLREALRRKAA